MYDNLLIDRDGGVAIVTFNRPAVLNAIDAQTLDALRRAILDLQRDDSVRVVVLTGAGEKAFAAGADIHELAAQTPTSGREHALAGQHVFDLVENMVASTEEMREGTRAFLEKRKPVFTGH